jgi:hypothetical protein
VLPDLETNCILKSSSDRFPVPSEFFDKVETTIRVFKSSEIEELQLFKDDEFDELTVEDETVNDPLNEAEAVPAVLLAVNV